MIYRLSDKTDTSLRFVLPGPPEKDAQFMERAAFSTYEYKSAGINLHDVLGDWSRHDGQVTAATFAGQPNAIARFERERPLFPGRLERLEAAAAEFADAVAELGQNVEMEMVRHWARDGLNEAPQRLGALYTAASTARSVIPVAAAVRQALAAPRGHRPEPFDFLILRLIDDWADVYAELPKHAAGSDFDKVITAVLVGEGIAPDPGAGESIRAPGTLARLIAASHAGKRFPARSRGRPRKK